MRAGEPSGKIKLEWLNFAISLIAVVVSFITAYDGHQNSKMIRQLTERLLEAHQAESSRVDRAWDYFTRRRGQQGGRRRPRGGT